MTLEYKLGIKTIPSDTAVLDIYYGKHESYIKTIVSKQHYDYLPYRKSKIYIDITKCEQKLLAIHEVWRQLKIQNIIVHISDSLLQEDNTLEHILSSIVRTLFYNIYKDHSTITVTHNGAVKKQFVEKCIGVISKVQMARKLAMIPANKATPLYMATYFKKLFNKKAKCKILKSDYLNKHGFGLIQAVGQGAANPPCMLVIERLVNKQNPTICIVGKGITFDSGGLSLKPYNSIINMKFDKIGAVNGSLALLELVELKELKNINLIGLFPFAENAVSDTAIHPGDVVTSYSGKTVEILNPDAEGRLILADALSYSHKYKPDLIIDIATLTGHATRINCWHYGYYFATPEPLKINFEKLTNDIGERMLPMPTWTEYREVLESPVADLVNTPNGNCGDSFVAALFLREFIPKDTDWLHIDLTHEYNSKTSIPRGNGIRSIIHVVEEYIAKKK